MRNKTWHEGDPAVVADTFPTVHLRGRCIALVRRVRGRTPSFFARVVDGHREATYIETIHLLPAPAAPTGADA